MQIIRYILTIACPDRVGIVAAVSSVLAHHEGNIVESDQFSDTESGRFFMRLVFDLDETTAPTLLEHFAPLARRFEMDWRLYDPRQRPRLLILVSKAEHCLNDLLFRAHSGQLPVEIAAVASNHTDHAGLASSYGIPFHHLPVTPETRPEQEQQIIDLARDLKIDLVVLARYMQILSTNLCQSLSGRAINIHHSFLPSFKGARPYHQAHARGVKIIGATAHYVTADLDEGPIIEQDVEHVTHSVSPAELTQIGSDVESLVLARAVRAHVEHRILLNDQRTVVFR